MQLGEEIGRGVRSVVYALGTDDVVKVPNADVPPEWLIEELRLTDAVARSGAPVPTHRRLVHAGGRPALASRRVRGPVMSQLLRADPDRAASLGADLAGIQSRLSLLPPSFELPAQRDRLVSKIHRTAAAHGDDILAAIELMPATDEPLVLCHGDLHPRNVLMPVGGEVLVDWFDASRGVLPAEIARTLALIDDTAEIDPWAGTLGAPIEVFRRNYASVACELAGIAAAELAPWLVVQRVARVAEGFGEHRLDDLRREIASLRRR